MSMKNVPASMKGQKLMPPRKEKSESKAFRIPAERLGPFISVKKRTMAGTMIIQGRRLRILRVYERL